MAMSKSPKVTCSTASVYSSHYNHQQNLYCKPQCHQATRILLCCAGQKKAVELKTHALHLLLACCAILGRFSWPLWPSAHSSVKRETRRCFHRILVKTGWFDKCLLNVFYVPDNMLQGESNTECDTIYKKPSVSWPRQKKGRKLQYDVTKAIIEHAQGTTEVHLILPGISGRNNTPKLQK